MVVLTSPNCSFSSSRWPAYEVCSGNGVCVDGLYCDCFSNWTGYNDVFSLHGLECHIYKPAVLVLWTVHLFLVLLVGYYQLVYFLFYYQRTQAKLEDRKFHLFAAPRQRLSENNGEIGTNTAATSRKIDIGVGGGGQSSFKSRNPTTPQRKNELKRQLQQTQRNVHAAYTVPTQLIKLDLEKDTLVDKESAKSAAKSTPQGFEEQKAKHRIILPALQTSPTPAHHSLGHADAASSPTLSPASVAIGHYSLPNAVRSSSSTSSVHPAVLPANSNGASRYAALASSSVHAAAINKPSISVVASTVAMAWAPSLHSTAVSEQHFNSKVVFRSPFRRCCDCRNREKRRVKFISIWRAFCVLCKQNRCMNYFSLRVFFACHFFIALANTIMRLATYWSDPSQVASSSLTATFFLHLQYVIGGFTPVISCGALIESSFESLKTFSFNAFSGTVQVNGEEQPLPNYEKAARIIRLYRLIIIIVEFTFILLTLSIYVPFFVPSSAVTYDLYFSTSIIWHCGICCWIIGITAIYRFPARSAISIILLVKDVAVSSPAKQILLQNVYDHLRKSADTMVWVNLVALFIEVATLSFVTIRYYGSYLTGIISCLSTFSIVKISYERNLAAFAEIQEEFGAQRQTTMSSTYRSPPLASPSPPQVAQQLSRPQQPIVQQTQSLQQCQPQQAINDGEERQLSPGPSPNKKEMELVLLPSKEASTPGNRSSDSDAIARGMGADDALQIGIRPL